MISSPKKSVSVMMPLAQYERLTELAKETDRTVPAYIRQILRRYLQDLDRPSDEEENWYPPAK